MCKALLKIPPPAKEKISKHLIGGLVGGKQFRKPYTGFEGLRYEQVTEPNDPDVRSRFSGGVDNGSITEDIYTNNGGYNNYNQKYYLGGTEHFYNDGDLVASETRMNNQGNLDGEQQKKLFDSLKRHAIFVNGVNKILGVQ